MSIGAGGGGGILLGAFTQPLRPLSAAHDVCILGARERLPAAVDLARAVEAEGLLMGRASAIHRRCCASCCAIMSGWEWNVLKQPAFS